MPRVVKIILLIALALFAVVAIHGRQRLFSVCSAKAKRSINKIEIGSGRS